MPYYTHGVVSGVTVAWRAWSGHLGYIANLSYTSLVTVATNILQGWVHSMLNLAHLLAPTGKIVQTVIFTLRCQRVLNVDVVNNNNAFFWPAHNADWVVGLFVDDHHSNSLLFGPWTHYISDYVVFFVARCVVNITVHHVFTCTLYNDTTNNTCNYLLYVILPGYSLCSCTSSLWWWRVYRVPLTY
jgi:hypothetical protein